MKLEYFVIVSVFLIVLSGCGGSYDEKQINEMLCIDLPEKKELVSTNYSSTYWWDTDFDLKLIFSFAPMEEDEFLLKINENLCNDEIPEGCGCWRTDTITGNSQFVPLQEDVDAGKFYKAEYINDFNLLILRKINI